MGAAPATSRASTLAACGDVVDERNASTDGRLPDPRPDESALKVRLAALAGHLAASERAGGWAHALGSPLGAIAQFAEAGGSIGRKRQADPELVEAFGDIVTQVERAKKTLTAIRASARERSPNAAPTDLNTLLASVADTVAPIALSHGAAVERDLAEDLPQVIGDPVQLADALFSIVFYALDAAPGTPVLIMRTEAAGDKVCAGIRVPGDRPTPESADAAIASFFVELTSGFGLGLGVARAIAERHGGRLLRRTGDGWVEFVLQLPPGIKAQWLMAKPTSG